MSNVVVKDIPKNLNISWEIVFSELIKILDKNYIFDIDFKDVDDKFVSQSMINSISDMEKEIKKNGLSNFTSLSTS